MTGLSNDAATPVATKGAHRSAKGGRAARGAGRADHPSAQGEASSDRGALVGMIVLLAAVLLFGGSSRSDLPNLIFLRPLSILLLAFALWRLRIDHVRSHPWIVGGALLILVMPLLQLVPLPPAIWRALPGRELLVEIDAKAGLGDVWRPISLVPSATWNAFFALFAPLAALIFGLRLSVRDRTMMLPLLLGAGFFSALLGMLQILGPDGGMLRFYPVTHEDSAVGLFANRNHQAAFLACLFPALALFATTPTGMRLDGPLKPVIAAGGAFILIPLILITGSRAGLVAGVLGIVLAGVILLGPLLKSRRSSRRRRLTIMGVVAIPVAGATLAIATAWLGRAESLQRLLLWQSDDDYRMKAWQPIIQLIKDYFPVGSGYGSFKDVYQINEPRELLHRSYFNQAHNDWLEVLMTGGLPALLILAVVCGAVAWRLYTLLVRINRAPSAQDRFALLGLSVILILAFASTTDYPLRVPSIACIWVLSVIWAVPHRPLDGPEKSGRTFRFFLGKAKLST